MAIFIELWSGANNDPVNGRSGWTKFGAGTNESLLLTGSGTIKCDSGTDCPLFGQDVGGANHFAELTIPIGVNLAGIVSDVNWQVVVRADDRNRKIWATWNQGETSWDIFASDGFGRIGSTAGSWAENDVMRLEAEGTTYRLKKNNSQILSANFSNALFDGQTHAGIIVNTWTGAPISPVAGPYRSGLISDLTGSAGASARLIGAGYWG